MSSAPYDANNPSNNSNQQGESPDSPPAATRELLEQVLRQTIAASETTEGLEENERTALRSVVDRHGGTPLSLEPIAVELIEAMLRLRMAALSKSDKFWKELSLWIAQTMMDDPDSKSRLESLWANLERS